jgi:hypothetical protein
MRFLLALFGGLLLVDALCGQDLRPMPPEDPEHQNLRQVRDQMVEAFNRRKIDTLLGFLHPDVVVTWQNGEVSRKRDGVRKYYDKMLLAPDAIVKALNIEAVDVAELSILYGKDQHTAIAWGTMKDHYTLRDGMTFNLNTRWTVTLIREGGRWLVAEAHLSDNLFDNEILHIAVRRAALWTGIAALLIGLMLGAGISWFFHRGRAPRSAQA